MQYSSKFLMLIFIVPFISNNLKAQLKFKFNAESGVYFDLSSSGTNESKQLTRFLGDLEFNEGTDKRSYSLGIKLRPQFFNFGIHSIKYRLDGNYSRKMKELFWNTGLSYTNYNYVFTADDYSYGIFQLISRLELSLIDSLPLNLLVGFSNYDIDYENNINSDLYFISALFNKKLDKYSFGGLGIFVQKFNMKSTLDNGIILNSRGWKYGPQLKVQYMRSFLFNAEYRFLIHNSNNTKYPSFEHNINFLGGFIVSKGISIFILAEFNFIRTDIISEFDEINPIFYTPTQNENEIYLKSNFRVLKDFSLYSKIGYFRENFYLEQFKLDGLSILIGLEIKL